MHCRDAALRCQSSQGGMGSSPFIRTKRRKLEPPDAAVFLQESSRRGVQICKNKVKQKAHLGRTEAGFLFYSIIEIAKGKFVSKIAFTRF